MHCRAWSWGVSPQNNHTARTPSQAREPLSAGPPRSLRPSGLQTEARVPSRQPPLPPGLASSTSNIYTQSDVKCVSIYENQRWNPVTGYSGR